MLQSIYHPYGSLLDLLNICLSVCTKAAKMGPRSPGMCHLPQPPTMLCLMQPKMLLSCFVTRACFWFMFNFLFTRMKQICFSDPHHVLVHVIIHPQGCDCIFCCKTWWGFCWSISAACCCPEWQLNPVIFTVCRLTQGALLSYYPCHSRLS